MRLSWRGGCRLVLVARTRDDLGAVRGPAQPGSPTGWSSTPPPRRAARGPPVDPAPPGPRTRGVDRAGEHGPEHGRGRRAGRAGPEGPWTLGRQPCSPRSREKPKTEPGAPVRGGRREAAGGGPRQAFLSASDAQATPCRGGPRAVGCSWPDEPPAWVGSPGWPVERDGVRQGAAGDGRGGARRAGSFQGDLRPAWPTRPGLRHPGEAHLLRQLATLLPEPPAAPPLSYPVHAPVNNRNELLIRRCLKWPT